MTNNEQVLAAVPVNGRDTFLITRFRVFLEKIIVAQLVKKFSAF
jgi:hypothetical protein